TAGGYAGAHWAQRLPVAWVRGAVVATGVGMSALFFVRG
ncbi:sulfite exporter TauE/SafE family protein, partial [Aquabacterium sp. A08]|nr:sulfite exporter TauE/SafE family protein [Aquabacterium sp. A08]